MFRKSLMAALGLTVLLVTTEALAQVPATLVLKSGERVSGQLVDHSGVGFTMIVNGQERRFRTNDVAVVDFVGGGQGIPETELSGIRPGEHLMILRGGESVHGFLYDVGERNPLRITFRTPNGDRRPTSNEIGRIFLARPPAQPVATSGPAPAPAPAPSPVPGDAVAQATINVPANNEWTNTGISVRRGEDLFFRSNGTVQLSADGNDTATAGGSTRQRSAQGAPVPQISAGALIGRVGNSAPFVIANQARVNIPATGELQLGVNDDYVQDNNGQFTVAVYRPAGVAPTTGSDDDRRGRWRDRQPTTAPPAGAIAVAGNNAWTPTGVIVRKGDTINLSTSGQVQLSSNAGDVAAPAGSSRNAAGNAPVPNIPAGTLIGRIGNSRPFGIGNLSSVWMPESGELFLGINDDHVPDNSGTFYVVISR